MKIVRVCVCVCVRVCIYMCVLVCVCLCARVCETLHLARGRRCKASQGLMKADGLEGCQGDRRIIRKHMFDELLDSDKSSSQTWRCQS